MNLRETLASLNELDLQDIDFNNAGAWPMAAKLFCCLLVVIVIVVAAYFLNVEALQLRLAQVEQEEVSLRDQYRDKSEKVANLDAYVAQMQEMEQTFGALLKQLPSDTEVPGLLEDISSVGSLAGLEIQSIDLQPEVSQEFYMELPIQIEVTGGYHDLAAFVSGVAGLPRIVTLHDFQIKPESEGSRNLTMSIEAKTYRYGGDEQ